MNEEQYLQAVAESDKYSAEHTDAGWIIVKNGLPADLREIIEDLNNHALIMWSMKNSFEDKLH